MKVTINKSVATGTVQAPASKSMAHRLIICASLAEGESQIDGLAFSQDILATIDCMRTLGAKFEVNDDTVKITGIGGKITSSYEFQCRESGSTLRFIIPILMLGEVEQKLKGYGRLMQRPMSVYDEVAKKNEIEFKQENDEIFVSGKLKSGTYKIRGDISSQFISGLLFALALTEGDSTIELVAPIESRSYIDMTISAMEKFGVEVKWQDESTLFIAGNQKYIPCNMRVEGDFSNAAFLSFFNYLDGDVLVQNLDENSLQGDKVYAEYFNQLQSGMATLDVTNCPDLAPILMTLASEKNGCILKGTRRLKIKESDRGIVMQKELQKFGADIKVLENEIIINKQTLHAPTQTLSGHNDHRIVMSLACLCTKYGGEIEQAQAVEKSFPDFFEYMLELGLEVIKNDN